MNEEKELFMEAGKPQMTHDVDLLTLRKSANNAL